MPLLSGAVAVMFRFLDVKRKERGKFPLFFLGGGYSL